MRISIIWLLVLMLLTTSSIISAVPAFNAGFMLVNAQTDVATSASISVEPSSATGNQVVQVTIRIEPAPPTPTDIFRNLTVTFVRSDGYTNRLGPYDTRPDGSQDFVLAAPDLSGNHTIKLTFPGQTFANDTIHYLPSQSQTTLTVSPPPPPPPQPTGGSWEQKKSMQQARGKLGVAAVNGKIYAIGGSTETGRTPNSVGTDYKANGWIVGTNEEYDPATNTWSFKKTMPTPRFDFATVAYQNKIYCIGGVTDYKPPWSNLTRVNEVYDPATDTWATMSPMPIATAKSKANVLNGKIYLLGENTDSVLSQVYDPETDSWATGTAIPDATFLFGSAVVDGRIYALVRFSNGIIGFNSQMRILNPASGNWSSGTMGLHDFTTVVAATTGVLSPRRIYALSGWATMATHSDGTGSQPYGGNPDRSNQIYEPKNDSWTLGAPMRSGRQDFGVAVVDDKLYVIGGIVERYLITFGWSLYDDTPTAENELYTPVGYGAPDPSYDGTAPEIAVLSPENKTYTACNVSLTFAVNEPVSEMAYSLDGAENIAVAGNVTLAGLPNGAHNVTVYARDQAGNTGASETVGFAVAVPEPEPFPLLPVAVTVALIAAAFGAGLLLYRRKRRKETAQV